MRNATSVVAQLTVLVLGFTVVFGLARGATTDDILRPWAQDRHQTGRESVDTAWVRRYDGPAHGEDWATRLAVDSAGNVYVVGASMSDTGSNTQYLDFVTIKYYPNGDTAWVRREDFGGKDLPSGLGVDAQGNVYVTGTNNDSRMVTVKYGPTGNRLWHEFFGSQGGASDLVLDSHGNIIVCGSSYRASSDAAVVKYRPNGDTAWVSFYDWAGFEDYAEAIACGPAQALAATGYGAGVTSHYDCITMMYDSSGGRLWAAGYDGPYHGDDRAYDVAADGSGNVVAVGFGDSGYTTPTDYLILKYGSSGETLWTRRYNGSAGGTDEAVAVALNSIGNVFVTGFSRGQNTNYDYITIAYDDTGETLWVRRYNGPTDGVDQARALAVDNRGRVCVTGESYGGLGTHFDCATVMYDSLGETLWVRRFSTSGQRIDRGTCVALDEYGSAYVAGECDALVSGGDMVTIKYAQNGGVTEDSHAPVASRPSLVVEPSVFSRSTTARFCSGRAATARVTVFDAAGRRVATLVSGLVAHGLRSVTWDGCDERGVRLTPGVYVVVLEAGGQRTKVKVVMSE